MNDQDKKDLKNLEKNVSSDEKLLGAISYIFLLCLIPLLGKKDSEFAQFHAKQGLLLVLAWFAVWVLGMIPILGWLVILPLGFLLLTLLSVYGFLNAFVGRMVELPLIGKYARKINFN